MKKLDSIKKIRFVLTDFCNYQCKFCHNEGCLTKNTVFLKKENIFSLTKIAKDLEIKKITLTGGEPLSHPDIVEIVEEIKRIFPESSLGLSTNGMLFKESNFSIIRLLDRIRINFQSLNSEKLKEICGPGADLNRFFRLVVKLKEINPDLKICLNFVLTIFNKESLKEVVLFALKNDLDVKILEYKAINKDMYISPEYAKEILNTLSPTNTLVDYQDDDIYFFNNSKSKIRLCYSFCNGLRCDSCRKCGELRLTPRSTLKHCFDDKIPEIDIADYLDKEKEKVKEKILKIDQIKGRIFI